MMPAFLSPGSAPLSCPPAAPVHAWMPSSPCGPDCVESAVESGTLRVAGRILSFAAVLSTFPAAYLATPRRWRPAMQRGYARTLLSCCGIRVRVVDRRGDEPVGAANGDGTSRTDTVTRIEDGHVGRGLLVVADHVGWTDIVVLSAVQPMSFVARADLVNWPLLGDVARLVRVIPIEREHLRTLPAVVTTMVERLKSGERVGVFPEGTTWCGRGRGRMRPALFQAAIDAEVPVQPIRVRYLDRAGELSTVPGFVGTDTLMDSIRRVLRSRGVVAEVVLQPLEPPGTDRRDLALRCERALHDDHPNQAIAAGLIHELQAELAQAQSPAAQLTAAHDAPVRRPEAVAPAAMSVAYG
ncbi:MULTISPECIES: 1-acyl-sn-glycerol-3-phosphate acyltransferase [unclassified Nocardia]|uniref:lysophospholipid acyltransferase family protein n=1 Tax=unclassified Nocardia TaxID=2637762 RepID=UPI00278C83C5|nr:MULTISPECIES: lysophospholipid acyltransferase family protein [unclassified Nocardia]